jgi:hypothetical protein
MRGIRRRGREMKEENKREGGKKMQKKRDET